MKATIEAPVERKVVLEMTESEAIILRELTNYIAFCRINISTQKDMLMGTSITEDKYDEVIEKLCEALEEIL